MTGIYNFYITSDERVVTQNNPHVYDRLLLESGKTVWLRTERVISHIGREEAAVLNEPRGGEQFLGTVEV